MVEYALTYKILGHFYAFLYMGFWDVGLYIFQQHPWLQFTVTAGGFCVLDGAILQGQTDHHLLPFDLGMKAPSTDFQESSTVPASTAGRHLAECWMLDV